MITSPNAKTTPLSCGLFQCASSTAVPSHRKFLCQGVLVANLPLCWRFCALPEGLLQVCFADRGGPRALTASSGVLHLGDCVRFQEVSQWDWRGACIPLAGCRFGKISEVRFLRANRTGSGPHHDATPLACDPQAPWRLTALHNLVSVHLQLECADGAARLIGFE